MTPFIEFLRRYYRYNPIIGAEIGVYKAENSVMLLKNLDIEKFFLIDPYLSYPEYKEPINQGKITQEDFDKLYEDAQKALKPVINRCIFLREKSETAYLKIPPRLDFVYIDGNHSLEYVKKDILDYYPKIKEKGIIGGDNLEFQDVANVVIPFFFLVGLKLYAVRKTDSMEWWGIKETPFWSDMNGFMG